MTTTRSGRMPASSHASSALSTASLTVVRRAFAGLSNPRRWRFLVKNSLTEISRWRVARSVAVRRTMGFGDGFPAAFGRAFGPALGARFLLVMRSVLSRAINSSCRLAMASLMFGWGRLVLNRRESTRFFMPAATYLLPGPGFVSIVRLPELAINASLGARKRVLESSWHMPCDLSHRRNHSDHPIARCET